MTRTRVKFCGITRVEDAIGATALGVDALGLVFTRASKRFVELDNACAIRDALAPFVTTVALFMDDDVAWIDAVITTFAPDLLQFHGKEDAEFCARFRKPYLKALAMGGQQDVPEQMARHAQARGFLLDSHAPGERGGSGEIFDWSRVPLDLSRPLLLAGGLRPDNVAEAVRQVKPYGVDVSSGIETAPGIKDFEKMRKFIDEVTRASSES